ncbi:CbtB domain-containing protein [Variovorax sp. HJSM1_2]|uniref:CbtB domain-containing protein n=1 Tax=Variovorax sp. HJSM1_2 TaxID=3366263 RepID=UPI003BD97B81
MTAPSSSTTPSSAGDTARTTSITWQLAGAVSLGLVMLYGVAFAESPLLHNAAHDVRHVTVKPCH